MWIRVLGTASTGPRLGGLGLGAGGWQGPGIWPPREGSLPLLGTLAAGPQHMPENATKMAGRGPKADHTRQLLLCPELRTGGRHQAQAYKGPGVSRTGLPSALIPSPCPHAKHVS